MKKTTKADAFWSNSWNHSETRHKIYGIKIFTNEDDILHYCYYLSNSTSLKYIEIKYGESIITWKQNCRQSIKQRGTYFSRSIFNSSQLRELHLIWSSRYNVTPGEMDLTMVQVHFTPTGKKGLTFYVVN